MPTLCTLGGDREDSHFELPTDGAMVIGRSSKCDIALDDHQASRRHCQIRCKDGQFVLTDLDSKNGTVVNGEKVKTVVLEDGDVISVGATQFRYESPDQSDELSMTATAEGMPSAQADPFLGRTIDGYRIVGKLSETHLGVRYRAVNELTEGFVTMEILPRTMLKREQIVQRFVRQAKAGSTFRHPNVVQTLAAGKKGHVYYIVTEYLEGRTLRELLSAQGEHGQLDPALTLDIMLQVGRALEYAYEHSIVHRDIKPASIIVTADGAAKLDNLWLLKHIEGAGSDTQLTAAATPLGTLEYVAPEQIRDARAVDCRADIYSLGATIYRALTGHVPCKGETSEATVQRILNQVPKPIRKFNKKVPPSVAKPVERALSKDPADRQQDPHALVLELELARKYQVR